MLGYPEQAIQRAHAALCLADDLSHPFSMGFARHYAATVYVWCHQAQTALEQAEAEFALATEHGFPLWRAGGCINRGKALAELGQHQEGLIQLQEGMASWRATGSNAALPLYLGWLADICIQMGRTADAQSSLAEALTLVHTTGERCYEAELYRLKGALFLKQTASEASQAEACFHQALDVARQQQAKSLELRAATNLARLWQQQGKRQEAHEVLAPVYTWFTEGFDTADLQEPKALLDELA